MSKTVSIYLVRHGQTDLNRDGRFRGLTDAPLNETGRREASAAAAALAGAGLEAIYSSPMPRALQTARIIAGAVGAGVVTDGSFSDIDYGDWQGLTVEEVALKFGPGALEAWKRDPGSFQFPNGDSMMSVRERLVPALRSLASGGCRSVAVVSHLAVLKVFLLVALDIPFGNFWKLGLENGSVGLLTHSTESGFVLQGWNRAPEVETD